MRRNRLAAKVLAAIMAVSVCMPANGNVMTAMAAENEGAESTAVSNETETAESEESKTAAGAGETEEKIPETDGDDAAETDQTIERPEPKESGTEAADVSEETGSKKETGTSDDGGAEGEAGISGGGAEGADGEDKAGSADKAGSEDKAGGADRAGSADQAEGADQAAEGRTDTEPKDEAETDAETAGEQAGQQKEEEPLPGAMEIIYDEGIAEEGGRSAMNGISASAEEILSAEVIATDVETASEGCVLAGVYGKYVTGADEAIARINEIRKEACEEGVLNPDTGKPLTAEDYVPIKWSGDLEYIARIRAAESALTGAHERTNGDDVWTLRSPSGVQSYGEVLAWNWSESMVPGINQWYGEKADWVNQKEGAVTGHYTQMIDPTNLYVGIGTFCSGDTRFYNTTAGEFSGSSGLSESQMGMSGSCVQRLEMRLDRIGGGEILGTLHGARGDTGRLLLAAGGSYKYSEGLVYFMDGVDWKSADPSIVTVSEDGRTEAVDGGTTTIGASAADGKIAAEAEFVVKGIEDCDIALSETTYTYDGEEKEPELAVSYQGTELKIGKDYFVSYKDNLNAGTATVTITGSDEYKGSIEKTFTINKAPQTVTAEPEESWIGIYLTTGSRVKGIGDITYTSMDPSIATVDNNGDLTGCGDGTVTITVTASGDRNYLSGQASFAITVKAVYEVASGSCGSNAEWTYFNTGKVEIEGTGTIEAVQNEDGSYLWDKYYAPNPEKHHAAADTILIHEGITGIGSDMFSEISEDGGGKMSSSPVTVEIPDSVTSIGDGAFRNCRKLEKVSIGAGLKKLGSSAFSDCPELKEIALSEANKAFAVEDGALFSKDRTRLYKLVSDGRASCAIPEGTVTVGKEALAGLDALEQLDVPKSVKTFEEAALKGCSGLKDVYYGGTASRWGTLSVAENNDALATAEMHFAEIEKPVAELTVTLEETAYVYDGTEKKPAVTVMDGSEELEEGFHYQVSYVNNVNAGTASVKITGVVDYAGEAEHTFDIAKAEQKLTAKAAAASIPAGRTTVLHVSGAKGKTGDWVSSNKALATVTNSKVKGIKVGTVRFTVTAEETENYKAGSASVTVKILPAATTKLTAANQLKGIKLTWARVPGATGYTIYRNNKPVKPINSGTTVTWTDTAASANGAKFVYKVAAKAATGTSTLSRSVTTYRLPRPSITLLKNTATKKMTVKWGKNAKATGYQIQYGLKSNFSGAKSVTLGKASAVSKGIGNLVKGKTYYVRIRTYKKVGNVKSFSLWSPVKKVKISK